MILDFYNQNINSAMFIITSFSPRAKQNVELEEYRITADSDGSNDQYILDKCFGDLLKDLEDIGITFSVDYSDVTDDMGKLFEFLQFMAYLLPNSLYDLIKTIPSVQDFVGQVLDGTLGSDETLIQTYVSGLGGLDDTPALLPTLAEFLDQVYPAIVQTPSFTDYLKNMLELAQQERLFIEVDAEGHTTYRETIKNMIARVSDVVNLFSETPAYDKLTQLQDRLIKDLISPVNFIEYSYLFGNTPDTLPLDLVESFNQKWYHYRVSHPWCRDYYVVRKLDIDPTIVTMMYAFVYGISPTKESYLSNVKALLERHPMDEIEDRIVALYQE